MKNLLFIFGMMSLLSITTQSCHKDRPGCTNPAASNYDPEATEDNGNCIIKGCMNPDAENYNPDATVDDGSCIINGCMDANALNFNPDATVDDGSCTYRKDLYVGTYEGSTECDNPLLNQAIGNQVITFYLTELDGEDNKVSVKVDFNIDLLKEDPVGSIDENNVLTFDAQQDSVMVDVNNDGVDDLLNVHISGTLQMDTVVMDTLSGPMNVTVYSTTGNIKLLESECDVEALRK